VVKQLHPQLNNLALRLLSLVELLAKLGYLFLKSFDSLSPLLLVFGKLLLEKFVFPI
jgi:hypothetical protein